MKQKDLLTIGVIVIVAATFSFIISNKIFSSPKQQNLKAPIVEKISGDFPNPQTDEAYKPFFNASSIDPTQLIQHDLTNNQKTFGAQ